MEIDTIANKFEEVTGNKRSALIRLMIDDWLNRNESLL